MNPNTDKLYLYLCKNIELLQLPIIVEDGCDVFPILFSKIEQYIQLLCGNDCLRKYVHNAEIIVQRLKEAIESYLKGNINIANDIIMLILEDTKKMGGKLIISTIDECLSEDEMDQLYKARTGSFQPFSEDEMLHIPFNKRGLVQNQRYSINGMPCLYLGTSTYVCWEELSRPDFNSFWVSRYEVKDTRLKILNLSYTLQDIMNYKNHNSNDYELERTLIEYFLYWIIQCACSIFVKNKNRVFKEEHIIPQLIMQNIRRTDIDGIMYFSTRGKYTAGYRAWIMKNFAFPADDYEILTDNVFDNEKYKENKLSRKLKEAFSLTAPLNMGLIRVRSGNEFCISEETKCINEALKYIEIAKPSINSDRISSLIALSEKNYMRYEYTKFYEMELELRYMIANRIT
ncbi:hypothetical protein [Lachnoclostridium phytofermentans]|uniref:RES domain-containing protein n=1 Tax=Lachnoclostridium phytofermentans (strain ATCC 700394 / DSM 18823 / ISDg) TaxID=357809 RepID=A9KLH5_LACP7|nr:hypothetical protein [Lachnoclostridium phytofermentans]ABX41304.1 hypothetical protein Cphy_0919 [Lachnoclostridium phytofermentans ISDg]